MKFLFILFFGLSLGFFDLFYIFLFMVSGLFFFIIDFSFFWFGGLFFCDSLSFFLGFLSCLILIFCVYSSMLDMWASNLFGGFVFVVFCIFFLLFLAFFSFNILFFYMCFELIFMFMYYFVLSWGHNPERIQASFYMVFYTILVSLPFFVYIILFEVNEMSLKFLFFYNFSFYWDVLVILVFLVKLPVYGVHLWLPKAHVEAPISGSMVLAGVLLKLGGYGILRLFYYIHNYNYMIYIFVLGLGGGLITCFLCLRQFDLKAFVAYSSICHMGYGLGGLLSCSFFGWHGGIYMLIAHGFCSSCLFYILYVFYERFHTRSLFILKGLTFVVPSIVTLWFIFSIFNMGVPPSFSFFSEVIILVGMSNLYFWSFFISGLFLFFAGLYSIFLFIVSCHGCSVLNMPVFFSIREYLNMYGHGFPLIFVPFILNNFYY